MSELAEGARLEIVCVVYSGTEGSNPSLSATFPQCAAPSLFNALVENAGREIAFLAPMKQVRYKRQEQ